MITVEMVRDKGFEFVAGDVIAGVSGLNSTTVKNAIHPLLHCWTVKEFAPRPNKGSMPCDGELLVDVIFNDESGRTDKAHNISWLSSLHYGSVKSWKPSLSNWSNEMNDNQDIETVGAEVEWVNGDECVFTDSDGVGKTCTVIGLFTPFKESYVLHCVAEEHNSTPLFISNVARMKKPETPESKEARERLESAYDLYCVIVVQKKSFNWFNECAPIRDNWLAIVDKTNYRKESK